MYVLIAMGRMPTKGYAISIESAEQVMCAEHNEPIIHIKGTYVKPAKGTRVQQVTSYPLILFWLAGTGTETVLFTMK